MHSRELIVFSIDSLTYILIVKNMSYHLEDPYRYLPKCFPFIDPNRPYSSTYLSNRVTEKNRQIEGKMIELKQDYLAKINQENQTS